MNPILRSTGLSLLLGALAVAPGCAHQRAAAPAGEGAAVLTVTPKGERAAFEGTDKYFTGQAAVSMLFSPNGPRDFGGAYVTFQPGARTAWHAHPAGQTLVVTEGTGWVQVEGQARHDMKAGDVVWIPPNVRHWHGATATTAMTHIALQGQLAGAVVDWQEPVSDAQYVGPAAEERRP